MNTMRYTTVVCALLLLSLAVGRAEGPNASLPARVPGIGPAGPLVRVQTGLAFTEGPAADAEGNLYFTDIPPNRILRLGLDGKLSTFLEDSRRCNGLMVAPDGRLFACQGGAGRVITIDPRTKAITVVADKYRGEPFNEPNDLVLDRQGGVYFTDPQFRPGPLSQDKRCVYYVSAKGEVTRVIDALDQPNGIGLAPDEKTLYVLPTSKQGLYAYPVLAPGKLGPGKPLGDVRERGDGMTVDTQGNLYLTLIESQAVGVLSPDGKRLLTIKIPETPSNCAFGGRDRKTLYVTAQKSLYAIPMEATGWRPAAGQGGGKQ